MPSRVENAINTRVRVGSNTSDIPIPDGATSVSISMDRTLHERPIQRGREREDLRIQCYIDGVYAGGCGQSDRQTLLTDDSRPGTGRKLWSTFDRKIPKGAQTLTVEVVAKRRFQSVVHVDFFP